MRTAIVINKSIIVLQSGSPVSDTTQFTVFIIVVVVIIIIIIIIIIYNRKTKT
jgi:hypothetical protein